MKIPAGLNLTRIEKSPVLDSTGLMLGWEAYAFEQGRDIPIGGGFGKKESLAIQIAVSESIERHLVLNISEDLANSTDVYGIKKDRSTSGFAYGSDQQQVAIRALGEAFEHFVRYHGVHRGLKLEDFKPEVDLSDLAERYHQEFDEVKYLTKTCKIKFDEMIVELTCLVSLGLKDEGIYLGASVGGEVGITNIEHALLESWRNLRIVRSFKDRDLDTLPSLRQRNIFFGENAKVALANFNSSTETWPEPEIDLYHVEYNSETDGFLGRCKLKGLPLWSDLMEMQLI